MILVDGDIIAHRSAWGEKDGEVEDALAKVDDVLGFILDSTMFERDMSMVEIFVSGESKDNFRCDIFPDYKANRKGSVPPPHLGACFDYLIGSYGATIAEGQEADDEIVQRAYEVGFDKAVIASIDKDFNQVPCRHFNFYHNKYYTQSEWDAHVAFYSQILTGDRQDNIPGLNRVGPKTAEKILVDCKTERDLFRAVDSAYQEHGVSREDMDLRAQLLWLRREKGVNWFAPKS